MLSSIFKLFGAKKGSQECFLGEVWSLTDGISEDMPSEEIQDGDVTDCNMQKQETEDYIWRMKNCAEFCQVERP